MMSSQHPSNIANQGEGDLALLGFFRDGPLHGYEVHRRLADANGLGLVWCVKQAQLYAHLAGLEARGYLRGVLEPQDGRPPRRVFHLTERGRETFEAWLAAPVARPRAIRLEFMQKLYFARAAGETAVARLVAEQRAVCESWLARQAEQPGESDFAAAVHAYRRGQLQSTLDWLDSLITREERT